MLSIRRRCLWEGSRRRCRIRSAGWSPMLTRPDTMPVGWSRGWREAIGNMKGSTVPAMHASCSSSDSMQAEPMDSACSRPATHTRLACWAAAVVATVAFCRSTRQRQARPVAAEPPDQVQTPQTDPPAGTIPVTKSAASQSVPVCCSCSWQLQAHMAGRRMLIAEWRTLLGRARALARALTSKTDLDGKPAVELC